MRPERTRETLTVLDCFCSQLTHPCDVLAKGTRRGAFGRSVLLVRPPDFLDLVNERRGCGPIADAKARHSERLRQRARDQHAVKVRRFAHPATVGELAVRLVDNDNSGCPLDDAINGPTARQTTRRVVRRTDVDLSLIHISEPTRLLSISYAV